MSSYTKNYVFTDYSKEDLLVFLKNLLELPCAARDREQIINAIDNKDKFSANELGNIWNKYREKLRGDKEDIAEPDKYYLFDLEKEQYTKLLNNIAFSIPAVFQPILDKVKKEKNIDIRLELLIFEERLADYIETYSHKITDLLCNNFGKDASEYSHYLHLEVTEDKYKKKKLAYKKQEWASMKINFCDEDGTEIKYAIVKQGNERRAQQLFLKGWMYCQLYHVQKKLYTFDDVNTILDQYKGIPCFEGIDETIKTILPIDEQPNSFALNSMTIVQEKIFQNGQNAFFDYSKSSNQQRPDYLYPVIDSCLLYFYQDRIQAKTIRKIPVCNRCQYTENKELEKLDKKIETLKEEQKNASDEMQKKLLETKINIFEKEITKVKKDKYCPKNQHIKCATANTATHAAIINYISLQKMAYEIDDKIKKRELNIERNERENKQKQNKVEDEMIASIIQIYNEELEKDKTVFDRDKDIILSRIASGKAIKQLSPEQRTKLMDWRKNSIRFRFDLRRAFKQRNDLYLESRKQESVELSIHLNKLKGVSKGIINNLIDRIAKWDSILSHELTSLIAGVGSETEYKHNISILRQIREMYKKYKDAFSVLYEYANAPLSTPSSMYASTDCEAEEPNISEIIDADGLIERGTIAVYHDNDKYTLSVSYICKTKQDIILLLILPDGSNIILDPNCPVIISSNEERSKIEINFLKYPSGKTSITGIQLQEGIHAKQIQYKILNYNEG